MSDSIPSPNESKPSFAAENAETRRKMSRISRRSFIWAGIAALATYKGIGWLASRTEDQGAPWPFRRVLDFNGSLAGDYFGPQRLAPTFKASEITKPPRTNGDEGMKDDDFDPSQWTLTVNNVFGKDAPVQLTLDDIKKLPTATQITEFCCIEGWSMKVEWKGVPMVEFAKVYPPSPRAGDKPDVVGNPSDLVRYVGMATPDGGYYVGLDMASALHPQTLLCYEMNGEPLTIEHGAPIRLVIPVKYGVKNIKRIGSITYTDHQPNDFWAEQGYDWFAGL
ncbi:MAG: molybdopterin-dependent oxidoreductase [Fimbriimonas sp.]|nr:molybdopterin-dependent oxidoreductase [Fimbriimonas sp.]